MNKRLTRSAFTKAATATAGLLAVPNVVLGADPPRLRYMGLQPPGFVLLFDDTMKRFRFDLKHGVNIDLLGYQPSLSAVYNDFIVGNIDFTVGGWDAFAARYEAGAPIALTNTIMTCKAVGIIANPSVGTDIKNLAGKTVAALTASGSYRLVTGALRDFHQFDLEKQATMQNVNNAAEAITLVQAGRADAAICWELFLSIGMSRIPGAKVIYNLGDDLKKNLSLTVPYFAYAIRREMLDKNPGLGARVSAAYADTIDWVRKHQDEAIADAAPKLQVPPEALKLAFTSGRFDMQPTSMTDAAARRAIVGGADFLLKNNGLSRKLDDGFFAVS
jgi:NitT/TauT family transport system substrate-binding protein